MLEKTLPLCAFALKLSRTCVGTHTSIGEAGVNDLGLVIKTAQIFFGGNNDILFSSERA